MNFFKLSLSERWKFDIATEPIHALLLGAGALFALLLFIQLPFLMHLPPTVPADFLPLIFSRGLFNSEPEEPFFFHLGIIFFPVVSFLFWRLALFLIEKLFRGMSDKIIFHAVSFYYAVGLFLSSFLSLTIFFIVSAYHTRMISFITSTVFFFGITTAHHIFLKNIARTYVRVSDNREKEARVRAVQTYTKCLFAFFIITFLLFIWLSLFGYIEYIQQYAYQALLFILLVCGGGGGYWLLRKRITFSKPWRIGLEILFVGILVPLLLWDPLFRYHVNYGGSALYHYNFFLGPVNDILHGKLLMVNTDSQYGILLTYGLAFLFRYLVPLSYANFYIVVMAVSIIYYWMLHILLRMLTRSVRWSLLGLMIVFSIHLLAITALMPPHEAYSFPSVTPLRFMFDIPLFLLLLLFIRKGKRYLIPIAVATAFAVFYNLEIGISLGLALFSFFIFRVWFESDEKRTRVRELLLFSGYCILFFAMIAGFITLGTYFGSGRFPEWGRLLYFVKLYSGGFGALPLPQGFSLYHLVLSVYLIALLAIAVKKLAGHARSEDALWGTFAVYGVFIFHYYLNRSHINNLYVVIVPAAVLFTVGAKQVVERFKEANVSFKPTLINLERKHYLSYYGALMVVIGVLISVIGVVQGDAFAKTLIRRYKFNYGALSHYWDYQGTGFFAAVPQDDFVRTAHALRAHADQKGRVAILSQYDTILALMSGTANVIDAFFLEEQIWTRQELDRAKEQLQEELPPYLFIDRDAVTPAGVALLSSAIDSSRVKYGEGGGSETVYVDDQQMLDAVNVVIQYLRSTTSGEIFSKVLTEYEFVSHEGILDLYRRKSL